MPKVRLGEVLKIGNGRNYSALTKTGKYPVYGSGGLMGYTDNFLYDGESVLLPRKGTLDNIQYATGRFWTVDTVYFSKVSEDKVNPYYLYYHLKLLDLKNLNTGTGVPSMTQKSYEDIPLIISGLDMQKDIANILRSLDEKIELNNKINAKLEELARDLYNYWFVQFEFPDDNQRPYKTAGGAMVYNEVLKRKIPAGWKVKNLLDVAEWIGGAQPPKSTFKYEPTDGFIRFIQNRDYADSNHLTYIPIAKSNKICNEYDIMMDKYGDAGRIRFGLAGAYNVALARIKPENQDTQEYLRSFLGSESTYLYLYNACMASTRASLNEEILGNVNIAIPKDYMLERYQKISRDITNQILMIRDENKSLADIRDFLLPILMNGQVTVIA